MGTQARIGVALSGGGTRGIAHVAVLKVLEEHGIEPDVVAGTSAGAIAGALYAAGCSTDEMLRFVKEAASIYKVFRFELPSLGLTSLENLRERLQQYIPYETFEVLPKKFLCAAANVQTGKVKYFHEGPLLDAVIASASVPIVFKPVHIDGQLYVDGGLLDNLPAGALRPFCDAVIGVNVTPLAPASPDEISSTIALAQRVFYLTVVDNTTKSYSLCDTIIEVKEAHKYHLFSFGKDDEIYRMGLKAAKKEMDRVLEELKPFL